MLSIWRLEAEKKETPEQTVPYTVLLWPILLYDTCLAIPRVLLLGVDYYAGYAVSTAAVVICARAVVRWLSVVLLLKRFSLPQVIVGMLALLPVYQLAFFGFSADILADAVVLLVVWSSSFLDSQVTEGQQRQQRSAPTIERARARTVEAMVEPRSTAA